MSTSVGNPHCHTADIISGQAKAVGKPCRGRQVPVDTSPVQSVIVLHAGVIGSEVKCFNKPRCDRQMPTVACVPQKATACAAAAGRGVVASRADTKCRNDPLRDVYVPSAARARQNPVVEPD